MSGIAGLYWRNGRPVRRDDILNMVTTLRHRGPDDLEVWSAGSIGLGQCVLRTSAESLRGHFGGRSPGHDLVITADARLDNRNELLDSLNVDPARRVGTTDSQLILSAYEHWSEGCVRHLVGDFAFAIWDGHNRTLFCARDHFGVKPFYYHRSNEGFSFASEIKALLCLAEVPRRLNEERVGDFLAVQLQDASATFYRDVLRLPPAHTLTMRDGEMSIRRYWQLDPARESRGRTDEEYAEGFSAIFTEAVRARLRGDGPRGSMLSGGLDSSSIVCVARRLLGNTEGQRLYSFSAVFPGIPESDESTFIQAVLQSGSVDPHFVNANTLSPFRDIDQLLACQDEPFFAPNLFLHWALYEAARAQGVRVLLDGLDGDLTVSHGIGALQELARRGRWIGLAREIAGLSRNFNYPAWGILARHVVHPFVPEPVLAVRRAIRGAQAARPGMAPLMSPSFARRIGLAERQRERRDGEPKGPRTARQAHYRGLTQGLVPYILEVADHAAMAFSIEPRYPFFDKRLAEYCLALPPEQKLHRGWTRIVMRRAMAGILPHEVQWRGGKADLGASFFRNVCARDADRLGRLVHDSSAAVWDYAERATLRQMYERSVVSGHKGDVLGLWQVATLESWLRTRNGNRVHGD